MLIIGGLLALAVVAIVGAILLGIGEDRAEKQKLAESSATQAADVTATPTLPLVPPATPEITTSAPAESFRNTKQLAPSLHEHSYQPSGQLAPSLHEHSYQSAYRSGQLAVPELQSVDSIVIPRSQFQSITNELRLLSQRASDLEQRLNMLSEVLESLPEPQDDVTLGILPVPSLGGRE